MLEFGASRSFICENSWTVPKNRRRVQEVGGGVGEFEVKVILMEHRIVRTEDLTIGDLPPANADWNQLTEFALSFDPRLEIGEWIWSNDLLRFSNTSSIKDIRSYIYFMQRWWNNKTQEISEASLNEIRSAVLLIRLKLSEE